MPNANRGAVGFQSSEFEQKYERPSKSQLKREMTALQKLGEALVDAPRDRVKKVPMPEDVLEAILECQQISSHEGRRRQLQFATAGVARRSPRPQRCTRLSDSVNVCWPMTMPSPIYARSTRY